MARSVFSRRSLQATAGQRTDHGPRRSRKTCASRTPATYGLQTPRMRAPANRCRIARSAGVAITTSPTQFGKKTAMFMAWTVHGDLLRRAHLLNQPARRVAAVQSRQVDAAAIG